ncbi:kxDL motif-containing protein 1 isoform X1 [Latimeria chalumnae]
MKGTGLMASETEFFLFVHRIDTVQAVIVQASPHCPVNIPQLCAAGTASAGKGVQGKMEPTASGMFCGKMLSMVNSEDVNAIIQAQRHMLDRFEKTNEMLLNFNNLSNVRLQQMNERFQHHTRTLVEMKKDLDSIFRRIRTLKGKLAKQYPDAFSSVHESPILEDDEDYDPVLKSTATTILTSEQSTESCDTSPDIISSTTSQDLEDLYLESFSVNGQNPSDEEIANGDD